MRNIKFLNLFIVLFLLVCCEPSDDDGTTSSLPNLTTEGKNTFGCKINEQIFLPKYAGGLSDPTPILKAVYVYDDYYYNGYVLSIFADNEILEKSIHIETTGSQTPLVEGSTYPIILKEGDNVHASYFYRGEFVDTGNGTGYWPDYKYHTTNEQSGQLKIEKLDTDKQIISGTFWFNCQEINSGEIVKISEGRFDINYTIFL